MRIDDDGNESTQVHLLKEAVARLIHATFVGTNS